MIVLDQTADCEDSHPTRGVQWGLCGLVRASKGEPYWAHSTAEAFFPTDSLDADGQHRGYENLWIKAQVGAQLGWLNLLSVVDDAWHEEARKYGLVTAKTERERTQAGGLYSIANELVGRTAMRSATRVDV